MLCCSVPSILRNSRYRRDQRQMDEEEEMWFNEDEDFDDNETVVSSTAAEINSKKDTDLESIGKMIEKKAEPNGPKINNNSTQKSSILNNNATGGPQLNPVLNENKSALFKRVCTFYFFVSMFIKPKIQCLFCISVWMFAYKSKKC